MSLEYTQPHDQSVAPSLVIDMANPRILVLFRQVLRTFLLKCGMPTLVGLHTVVTMTEHLRSLATSLKQLGFSPGPVEMRRFRASSKACHLQANAQTYDLPCRFLHDIAFGMSIVARGLRTNTDLLDGDTAPKPAAEPSAAKGQGRGGPKQPPLQLLLHVSNLSVLLPASSK